MRQTLKRPLALDQLEAIDSDSGLVNVVIDTPRNSRAKFKYDEKTGLFRLGKLLPLGARFPFDFGFVPSTHGEDGDALDVLVLLDEPVPVGCVLTVLLIGVLEAEQTDKEGKTIRNDRLIGVVQAPYNPPEHRSLDELSEQCLAELEHFFIAYNEMEGRRYRPIGRGGPEAARKLLKKGQ
jgi:inorganic pyrophosphatase